MRTHRANTERAGDQGDPVCVRCFTPFAPGANACSACGSAVGQHTEYVPFVNIPWQVDGYSRLMRSTWPAGSGALGQIGLALVTLELAPLLLLALPFRWLAERRRVWLS